MQPERYANVTGCSWQCRDPPRRTAGRGGCRQGAAAVARAASTVATASRTHSLFATYAAGCNGGRSPFQHAASSSFPKAASKADSPALTTLAESISRHAAAIEAAEGSPAERAATCRTDGASRAAAPTCATKRPGWEPTGRMNAPKRLAHGRKRQLEQPRPKQPSLAEDRTREASPSCGLQWVKIFDWGGEAAHRHAMPSSSNLPTELAR